MQPLRTVHEDDERSVGTGHWQCAVLVLASPRHTEHRLSVIDIIIMVIVFIIIIIIIIIILYLGRSS